LGRFQVEEATIECFQKSVLIKTNKNKNNVNGVFKIVYVLVTIFKQKIYKRVKDRNIVDPFTIRSY